MFGSVKQLSLVSIETKAHLFGMTQNHYSKMTYWKVNDLSSFPFLRR